MNILRSTYKALELTPVSLKSIVKIILQSRRPKIDKTTDHSPIIIMGNGPSLADAIRDDFTSLTSHPTIAVNFAANTDEFFRLRPRYYVLADPLFFGANPPANVIALQENLARVDWPMTLFVPCRERRIAADRFNSTGCLTINTFNPVGIEGWTWLENLAYSHAWGMPRPRNVLIPSIMIAIALGYKKIYIAGADHSWTRTISVNERNEVVSIQPHFYKDDDKELKRVRTDYLRYPLHQIIHSFYVAFRAYHLIARYARDRHIDIINSTPGSFIDAFPRGSLPIEK